MYWQCLLCYTCDHTLYRMYLDSSREYWFINVNLLESNVVQILILKELIFAIVKDNRLPTYLENNINAILKSPNNLFRLEEFDQQSSINIGFLPVHQLVNMNKIFGHYIQSDCLKKSLQALYPFHLTIKMEEQ